jgi:hypothetical protein
MNKCFFLINPTSIEEDVFFLTYGNIKESDCPMLIDFYKDSNEEILIISDLTEFDKFSELKKYEIKYCYEGFEDDFYYNVLSIPSEIKNLLDIKYSSQYFNLYLINYMISFLQESSNTTWVNYKYIPKNNSSLKNKIIVNNDFLFDLFQEDYSISCFGVKISNRNENDNIKKNLISHLSSDYFRFGNEEKRYSNINIDSLDNGLFSLIIENTNRNRWGKLSKLKIKLVKNNFDSNFSNNEIDVLREFEIVVLGGDKSEDNKEEYYFLFDKSDYKIFINLLNYIDKDFRFIWIDEEYFFKKFKNRIYKKVKYSLWSDFYLFGINIKMHKFYHRYSDYGSDNDTTIFFGDSKYTKLRNKKNLSVTVRPDGQTDQKNPGKYYGLEQNLFEYFYEKNKYVLINFDDIPYDSLTYKCSVDSIKHLMFHKIIYVPIPLIDDTFVLTTDYFDRYII